MTSEAPNYRDEVAALRARRNDAIALDYLSGLRVEQIAVKNGVSTATVFQTVKKLGVSRPRIRGSEKPERDAAIVSAYLGGKTLEEVGQQHGITRERVRQVLVRQGVEERLHGFLTAPRVAVRVAKSEAAERREARKQRKAAERQQARDLYTAGDSYAAIAEKMGRCIGWVQMAIWDTGGPSRRVSAGKPKWRLTPGQKDEIAARYRAGEPVASIAAAFGMQLKSVQVLANRLGAKRVYSITRHSDSPRGEP